MMPDRPRELFYANVAEEEADQAIARLVPQSMADVTETLRSAAWRTISSTYVICEQDQAIPDTFQEQLATRATSTRQLPTSHPPFLSRPSDVVRLIVDVAEHTGQSVG